MINFKSKDNITHHSFVGDTLEIEQMSLAERDALTGVSIGTLINNTTSNKLQRWSGVIWEDLNGTPPGGLSYQGLWNATTNAPIIPAAALANNGYYYKVGTAGTTTIDGISTWNVGDWIISNGVTWDRIEQADSVTSVNGDSGVVTVDLQSVLDAGNTANRDIQLDNTVTRINLGQDIGGEYGQIELISKDPTATYSVARVNMNAEEGLLLEHGLIAVSINNSLGTSFSYSGFNNTLVGTTLTASRTQRWADANGTIAMSVNGVPADSQGNISVTVPLPDYSVVPILTGRKWIDGKDVYEVVISNTYTGPDTDKLTIVSALGYETIIRTHAKFTTPTSTTYDCLVAVSPGDIQVIIHSDLTQLIEDGSTYHVIIEYTQL